MGHKTIEFLTEDSLSERASRLMEAWRGSKTGDYVQLHAGQAELVDTGEKELCLGIELAGQIFPFRLSEGHDVLFKMKKAWRMVIDICRDEGRDPGDRPELIDIMEAAVAHCEEELGSKRGAAN